MDLRCGKFQKNKESAEKMQNEIVIIVFGFFCCKVLLWYISIAMWGLPTKGKSNLRVVKNFWTTPVSTAIF